MKNPPKEILILEEDPDLGELLRVCLRKEGYRAALCQTAREALSQAAERPVDLLILGFLTPHGSGPEVCRRLQKISYPWGIPVVHLRRPCDPAEVLRTVKLLLDQELIYL